MCLSPWNIPLAHLTVILYHLFIKLFHVFLLSCKNPLYILDSTPQSDIFCRYCFPRFWLVFSFFFFNSNFGGSKGFTIYEVHFLLLFFRIYAYCKLSKKSIQKTPNHNILFSNMFFYKFSNFRFNLYAYDQFWVNFYIRYEVRVKV